MRNPSAASAVLAFALALSFAAPTVSAQAPAAAALPARVDPFRFISPADPAFPVGDPYGLIYGFPRVRVWGWSRTGAFAYSVERGVEGRGGGTVRYVIQDLATDAVLWSLEYDSFAWDDPDPADGDFGPASWERVRGFLEPELRRFGIERADAEFREFPLSTPSRSWSAALELVPEPKPGFADAVKSYAVRVRRDDGRSKIVRRVASAEALRVFVCGFWKSPFEDRIAVVTAEERFVFEGTELFYAVSGCDLSKGF